tara:strand:- start:812 stop:979 length:168 start_codon:yes stop_codon:yes gene_type:complete
MDEAQPPQADRKPNVHSKMVLRSSISGIVRNLRSNLMGEGKNALRRRNCCSIFID